MLRPSSLKLPNFFLAGAPKSGTTSLYHYLSQHPQIYMSPIKEPRFFGVSELISRNPAIKREEANLQAFLNGNRSEPGFHLVTQWKDYVELFRDVQTETAIGEASVGYFTLPSAAPAISAKLPHSRLIFLLRNPIECLFSWYLLSRRHEASMTFRAWVQDAISAGENRRNEGRCLALAGGNYATHLSRFLDHFPQGQVSIYLYESYRADVKSTLRDIFKFIDVDPNYPIDVSRRHNETSLPRFPAADRLRHRVMGNTSLTSWLPNRLGHILREFYSRRKSAYALDPADRKLVINYYRDEILHTQDLIGRDLSAWLK